MLSCAGNTKSGSGGEVEVMGSGETQPRVLRRDEDAHAERARLFHELNERTLGGRLVRGGRQEASMAPART